MEYPRLMPPDLQSFGQAVPHLARSLRRSNPEGDTLAELMEMVFSEDARLWSGEKSAAITRFMQVARINADEYLIHGGGEMEDLLGVLEFGAEACRAVGCDRLVIENTRKGWERVLADHGFRAVTVLVKEL
jgi:hypothetical protein